MNRGYFGIGIFHPKYDCNVGTLWRSAYAFGASFIYTIGPRFKKQASDTTKTWKSIPMFSYESFDDFINNTPYDCPIVGVELDKKALSLETFAHPERACYLLGAEDHGLPQKIMNACYCIVQIPRLQVCLNVSVVGTIIMYDRSIK